MSEDERIRWDERYRSGDYRPGFEPSSALERAIAVVSPGRALVLACGTGRNAIRLAEAGFEVEAVDISAEAIALAKEEAGRRGVAVAWKVADLETTDLGTGVYELVTMIRYVDRGLWPRAVEALASGGWLLTEQHLRTPLEVRGPGDEFRVAPGELLEAFGGLRVVEYSERIEPAEDGGPPLALARLLACKGDPGW